MNRMNEQKLIETVSKNLGIELSGKATTKTSYIYAVDVLYGNELSRYQYHKPCSLLILLSNRYKSEDMENIITFCHWIVKKSLDDYKKGKTNKYNRFKFSNDLLAKFKIEYK